MPTLKVLPMPDMIEKADLRGSAAAVVDVLRATSSIATAFSSGCCKVIPAFDKVQALSILKKHPGALVSGESHGLKIDGFDLGNSPAEYSPGNVGGRTVVMTTSNGTKAVLGAAKAGASPVFLCSFLNLKAVARAYLDAKWAGGSGLAGMTVVCSGSHGEFSLEDFACAGALVEAVVESAAPGLRFDLDDQARQALKRFQTYRGDIAAVFDDSPHGQYLRTIGFAADLAYCANESSLDVVPFFENGAVTLYGAGQNHNQR